MIALKEVVRKRKERGKKKMWKVVCKFYSGGKKTIGRFKTYRDADEFVRNPGGEFASMPCCVWTIEKER